MKKEGLFFKQKHFKVVTNQSDHSNKKYPNLIKDFIPTGTEQLWVSDITYIQVGKGIVYLSFIMDAFLAMPSVAQLGLGFATNFGSKRSCGSFENGS